MKYITGSLNEDIKHDVVTILFTTDIEPIFEGIKNPIFMTLSQARCCQKKT